jgi:hypothetical protein
MGEEIIQEKWIKGVVITTTCLAVMTSIAAARGTACVSKTQLLTAQESSKWAYYQAKSIKQNLAETQKNAFEVEKLAATNKEQKELYETKLSSINSDITRYENEKSQIKTDAENTAAKNKLLAIKGNYFSGAVVFFQLAIMLTSVSTLLKKKKLWYFGLAIGAVAAILLGYGLFLKPFLF